MKQARLPTSNLNRGQDVARPQLSTGPAGTRKTPALPYSRKGTRRSSTATATWWSWGESNPRPTLSLHAFSGRSLCRRSARLRPLSQTPKSTSPAWEESHVTSRRHHAARFLDDARIRIGITYGLTDYRARLRSEGEVSALCIGTYCFAGSVHEITLHPRPASRGFTGAVETDQPRGPSCEGAAVALWNYQRAHEAPKHHRLQPLRRPRHSACRTRRCPGVPARAPRLISDPCVARSLLAAAVARHPR